MILCLIRHSEFSESYYEVTDVSEAISVTVYWEFLNVDIGMLHFYKCSINLLKLHIFL